MSVVIETTIGDVTVDLFLNERPTACKNFLKLCKLKYYNYNLFHTISRGFIAQTGDPTGSRTGGESIFGILKGADRRYFQGENKPRIKHTKMGLISFVGNEEFMLGSQFFITLGEDLTYLDEKHCVFGEVTEGFDILEIINEVICDGDDRPYQDVRITHTVILDDPFPDPEGLRVPSRSPSPSAERLMGGRIAPDEEIDEMKGKSAVEIAELQADREAKARATILEMVGDIPDAEMAPPENVLFVCKLNPVTTDDDLEIIFNRFGKIKSCEVIRDRKTGDSLQYAFIEFEDRKACEDAYFKMDNILIDDRRIHVDFSQSVSKIIWHGKGRGVTHYDDKGKKIDHDNEREKKKSYSSSKKYEERIKDDKHHERSNKERSYNKSETRYENGNKENKSQYKNDEKLYNSKSKSESNKRTSDRDSRRSSIRDNKRHNSRDRTKHYEKDNRRSPVRDNRRSFKSESHRSYERDSRRSPVRGNDNNGTERIRSYEDKKKSERDSRKSPARDKTSYRGKDRDTTYNEKKYKKYPDRGSSRYRSGEISKNSEASSRRMVGEYNTSRHSGKHLPKEPKQTPNKKIESSTENNKRSKTDDEYKEQKMSKKDTKTKKIKEKNEEYRIINKSVAVKKNNSKSESSSESSDDNPKRKKKNANCSKKSCTSSSDSNSEADKNRKKKKCKKQESSDSDSSSTSTTSTSSSDSSEEDRKRRKKKKHAKRTAKKRETSDSSESEVEKKRKKR